MKKVYIVNRVCDEEYGNTVVVAVFGTEEQAKNYVNRVQKILDVWYEDDGIPEYSYEEWDVK